jgi:hypothetical protein
MRLPPGTHAPRLRFSHQEENGPREKIAEILALLASARPADTSEAEQVDGEFLRSKYPRDGVILNRVNKRPGRPMAWYHLHRDGRVDQCTRLSWDRPITRIPILPPGSIDPALLT